MFIDALLIILQLLKMKRINKYIQCDERTGLCIASLATWYDLLPTVIWPMNRTTKATVVAVIVQIIVIKDCACVCV